VFNGHFLSTIWAEQSLAVLVFGRFSLQALKGEVEQSMHQNWQGIASFQYWDSPSN